MLYTKISAFENKRLGHPCDKSGHLCNMIKPKCNTIYASAKEVMAHNANMDIKEKTAHKKCKKYAKTICVKTGAIRQAG